MQFGETNSIITIKDNGKCFIYFLLKGGEVVYVGKTSSGISIPLSHNDKDYDTVEVIACPADMLDSEESRYIDKYKPKYNTEVWRKIKDFPTYSVSNKGRIRNDNRECIRKIFIDKDGYPFVILSKNGSSATCRVHKLVANAFIPNPENKPYVDHIDTDRINNNVNNLRWVTQKENSNNPLTKIHRLLSQPEANRKRRETKKANKYRTD